MQYYHPLLQIRKLRHTEVNFCKAAVLVSGEAHIQTQVFGSRRGLSHCVVHSSHAITTYPTSSQYIVSPEVGSAFYCRGT